MVRRPRDTAAVNLAAASAALNVAYLLLEGRIPAYAEVDFDISSNKARAIEGR